MKAIWLMLIVSMGLACSKKDKVQHDQQPSQVAEAHKEKPPEPPPHSLTKPPQHSAEEHVASAKAHGIAATDLDCKEGSAKFVLFQEDSKKLVYCKDGHWLPLPKSHKIAMQIADEVSHEHSQENMVAEDKKDAHNTKKATFHCRRSPNLKNSFMCRLP